MFGAKALAAVALAGAALAAKDRSPNEPIRSFNVTLDRIVSLNGTVNKFSPSNPAKLDNAFAVQVKVNEIQNTLKYITKVTKNVRGVFNDDDSLSVAAAVQNLEDPITSTLNNVISHKDYFTEAVLGFGDLSATVLYDVKGLNASVGVIGAALEPHISLEFRSFAPVLTQEVQALFKPAAKAFAKCGRVCLPVITLLPGDGSVPGKGYGYGYGYGY